MTSVFALYFLSYFLFIYYFCELSKRILNYVNFTILSFFISYSVARLYSQGRITLGMWVGLILIRDSAAVPKVWNLCSFSVGVAAPLLPPLPPQYEIASQISFAAPTPTQ